MLVEFRTLIIDGTRYAGELKGTDRVIQSNSQLLKQDPSNQTLQKDIARKQAFRDECQNHIKRISEDIAIGLYKLFQQHNSWAFSPEPTEASSSSKAGSSNKELQKSGSSNKREIQTLTAHSKILEKQIKRNEEEVERMRSDHRQMIETLQKQLAAQDEEIRSMKELIQSSSSVPQPQSGSSSQDVMIIDSQMNSREEEASHIQSIESGLVPGSFPHTVVLKTRDSLNLMMSEIDNLRAEVVTVLNKDIPDNLQRTVRVMHQDVQTTLQTTTSNHIKHLTDLVRELVGDFETRLVALESIAKRLAPAGSNLHSDDHSDKPAIRSTQDPRLLFRRHSTLTSSETHASTENKPEGCMQQ